MRRCRGCQVSAGGKPHHTYLVRQHSKFFRAGTDHANRTLSVAKFYRMVIARAQPILQDKCRDAHGVQPIGNLPPFVIGSEESIASESEEHTSELQSPDHLVCRLLL